MVQGYKTSNSTGTGSRRTGNGYTILKGSVSPTPEKKENAEPCPVRMMIDIRMTNGIWIQQRNLTYHNLRNLMNFHCVMPK